MPDNYDEIVSNAFYGAVAISLLWELVALRRPLALAIRDRWPNNIALAVCNGAVGRWLLPVAGIALALSLEARGIGLFNAVAVPAVPAIAISVLALDFANYVWHRLTHAVPLFWRFHLVHHTDQDVDLTTGFRHHPVEAVAAGSLRLAVIAVLGAPAVAVFAAEILFGVWSLFQHVNVRIPARLERIIRLVLVTPEMHRIHHSADRPETDSNYSTTFSFWDRLCGTYRSEPAGGALGMILGLPYLRDRRELWFHRLLLHPFLAKGRLFAVSRSPAPV